MQVLETFDLSALIPLALDIVGALILLIVTFWVAGWARRGTARAMDRSRMDATLARFVSNVTRYGVLVLGGLARGRSATSPPAPCS
jgi:small-conductance mechanosensitive channel